MKTTIPHTRRQKPGTIQNIFSRWLATIHSKTNSKHTTTTKSYSCSRLQLGDSLITTFFFSPLYTRKMLSPKSLLQAWHQGQTRLGILTAGSTGEAAVMVEVAHGLASLVCSIHALAALHAGTWRREEGDRGHKWDLAGWLGTLVGWQNV